MRIVFFGNTEFSNPTLKKCNSSYDVISVVTNHSKQMGRGRKFLETPVKSLAEELKLNVIEIDNLNDEVEQTFSKDELEGILHSYETDKLPELPITKEETVRVLKEMNRIR